MRRHSNAMLQEPIDCVPGEAITVTNLPILLKAMVSLKRRRPNPGHPSGKLFKNFSRSYLLCQDIHSAERVAIWFERPHP
jgi:hypothetical protein